MNSLLALIMNVVLVVDQEKEEITSAFILFKYLFLRFNTEHELLLGHWKISKIQNILNVSHKQALEMKRFLKLSDASADPYFFHSIILSNRIENSNSSNDSMHVCYKLQSNVEIVVVDSVEVHT
jgi:hypothetical protein